MSSVLDAMGKSDTVHYYDPSQNKNVQLVAKQLYPSHITECKVAVNRLCNIADDVYRKQMIDYNLNDKQISNIEEILSGITDNELTDKIRDEIDSLGINSQNYKATITKLNNIKES